MSTDLELIRTRNLKWHRLVWPGGDQSLVNDYNQIGADRRALLDEIERLRRDLAIQTVNATAVLQAQHERDCAVEKLAELRKLLTDCADPVSCQLAEARRNLELYKGYSSRERRYQIEIEGLERLQKAMCNVDVPAAKSWTAGDGPCNCSVILGGSIIHDSWCTSLVPPVDVSDSISTTTEK